MEEKSTDGQKKTDELGTLLLFQKEFFEKPGFRKRFDHEMKVFRTLISTNGDRDSLKNSINVFTVACFSSIKEEKMLLHMHLEIFKTLSFYAENFKSVQTFENVIRNFENPELKQKLFGKEPLRSSMVYGEVLLKYYGLENEKNEGWFTAAGFDIITKAKYYILKAYTQSVEGKNKLTENEFSYCLVLLAACFMHLSRWFEPMFYLNKLKQRDNDDPNIDYLTALNLEALKDKSCLDYNGQLLLRIHDSCKRTIDNQKIDSRAKVYAKEILEKCVADIQRAKLSIKTLRNQHKRIVEKKRKRAPYFSYCIENQFFINEHSFFCDCGRSIGDSLEIKTFHPHTQLEWVKKFEKLLNCLISDYSLARHSLFQCESASNPVPFFKKENIKNNASLLRKDSLLKNSFKICYSILDQICYGILEAREIDVDQLLKEQRTLEENKRLNIYFLNMWGLCQFSEEDFRNNLYLISLYSLSRDLDRTDYSALKSFKEIRNAMEHKILFIDDSKHNLGSDFKEGKVISRSELLTKTKLLMVLTKSAIVSFAYLVRRESKIREMGMNKITT